MFLICNEPWLYPSQIPGRSAMHFFFNALFFRIDWCGHSKANGAGWRITAMKCFISFRMFKGWLNSSMASCMVFAAWSVLSPTCTSACHHKLVWSKRPMWRKNLSGKIWNKHRKLTRENIRFEVCEMLRPPVRHLLFPHLFKNIFHRSFKFIFVSFAHHVFAPVTSGIFFVLIHLFFSTCFYSFWRLFSICVVPFLFYLVFYFVHTFHLVVS